MAIFPSRPRSQGGELLLLPNFSIQEAGLPILPINRAAPYHLNSLLMFGKVLFYNYILFRIWNRIAISSVELRLSGVTLGFLTFPCSFFPSKKANKVHFYHIFLPSQMIISWVDIRPIRVRPSGTTPSNTDPHPPETHLGLVTELGLSVFVPSQLDLPA